MAGVAPKILRWRCGPNAALEAADRCTVNENYHFMLLLHDNAHGSCKVLCQVDAGVNEHHMAARDAR